MGSEFEITIQITNFGNAPAYSVMLTDFMGELSQVYRGFPIIEPGETVVTSIPLTGKEEMRIEVPAAHVTYFVEDGNNETQVVATSNFINEGSAYYYEGTDDLSARGVVMVLPPGEYARLHRGKSLEIVCYAVLGAIPALFPYIFFRIKRSEEEVLLKRTKFMK